MALNRYGGRHQAIRTATLPAAYGTPCARCGRLMVEGQLLDLDHLETGYGWSHARCNRSAGGRRAQQLRAARRRGRETAMLPDNIAIGLQISEDRSRTSVAAAARLDDDAIGVMLVAYADGTTAGLEEVARLRSERTVLAVVLDPRSQAATLLKPLTDSGVPVTQMSTSDVVVATGEFTDLVASHKLRVAPNPALDEAARFALQRPLGGAQAWERRHATVDVSPLDAATVAVWALLHATPKPFFAAVRSR